MSRLTIGAHVIELTDSRYDRFRARVTIDLGFSRPLIIEATEATLWRAVMGLSLHVETAFQALRAVDEDERAEVLDVLMCDLGDYIDTMPHGVKLSDIGQTDAE